MRAAIYARKSTEQEVTDDAKSVTRQIDGARAFIARQPGWTLDNAHVYEDPAVSGALFAKRPEFQRMMSDARAGAFDVLVLFDLDRFGRHAHKTMVALNELADVGVEVWDYSTGQPIDLDSLEGGLTVQMKAIFAQQFREQIRKHTRAAMRKKAEAGLVAGCPPFGYDAVGEKGKRQFRINAEQAEVVREIYSRFAAGEGMRSIALALNRRKVASPRAQQGRPCGWSQSTILAVLDRSLYRGMYIYGRSAKAYDRELKRVRRGTKREKGQILRPENTWVRVEMPELRIIPPDLERRADAKRHERRSRYFESLKRPDGRQPEKSHGKYLLTGGMLICPCGAHFEARKHPWKGAPGNVYICSARRRKPGTCNNTLALAITETDDAVLSEVEASLLDEGSIEELLRLVEAAPDRTDTLTADRERVRAQISNLVESLALGVGAQTIAPKLRALEQELSRVEAELRTVPPPVDRIRLRAALEQRVETWRADLRGEPKLAREVVRRLIGPLTLWDDSQRPEFIRWEAAKKPEALLEGVSSVWMASPTGFEPVFWP